jgi:hypothetical protein
MATGQKMGDWSETKVLDRAAFRIGYRGLLSSCVDHFSDTKTDALWLDED